MNKTTYIDIPIEVTNEIERFYYDYENYKDVIATCLDLHKLDVDKSFLDSVIFKEYQHQASVAFASYNMAKTSIDKYVPQDGKTYNWNLNFSTSQLELTEVA